LVRQFRGHQVIVVEDNPERASTCREAYGTCRGRRSTPTWGQDAWIIPRRSDAVRNYGFILAAREKPDMIVTLDDDCYPTEGAQENFLDAPLADSRHAG
jgi:hypothetical protein